ncbi:MAG TPA: hypothetical protein VLE73_04335 [Candidatus Saccharimonadales bacterium]|nr:hypothetical protein [Candidatus Saccharimonadales bacterium]
MPWPWVSREVHNEVVTERDYWQRQYTDIEPLLGFLTLAQELDAETQSLIQQGGHKDEIGRIAYENVMLRQAQKAKKELAARYEAQHRQELYRQVLADIEATQGADILQEVQRRVETDQKLAKQLHDSARKAILARAEGIVAGNITAEQERILGNEVTRQIELDKLDVQFMFDGKIDINDPRVTAMLKPEDRVTIYFAHPYQGEKKQKKAGAIFTWREDLVNNSTGWVLTDTIKAEHSYRSFTNAVAPGVPPRRFVQPAAELHAYSDGSTRVTPGILVRDTALFAAWENAAGEPLHAPIQIEYRPEASSHTQSPRPALIASIDFEVRDPQFVP